MLSKQTFVDTNFRLLNAKESNDAVPLSIDRRWITVKEFIFNKIILLRYMGRVH